MKSKAFRITFLAVLLAVFFVNMGYFIHNAFFYSLENLPQGVLNYPVMSPNGQATLRIYSVEIDGIGTAVRGEVITEEKTENIYWETGTTTAIATWVDDETVEINGNTVNINGKPYDSRRAIELPTGSAKSRLQTK